jgi:hypothetical protein
METNIEVKLTQANRDSKWRGFDYKTKQALGIYSLMAYASVYLGVWEVLIFFSLCDCMPFIMLRLEAQTDCIWDLDLVRVI